MDWRRELGIGDDEVVTLVSGLGATPVMELYILYDEVERLLDAQGITVHRPYVGNYFTSLEMAGITLTACPEGVEMTGLPAGAVHRYVHYHTRTEFSTA